MITKQKTNWRLDLGLFALFILAFFLDLTGVELHQWIGVLGGGLILLHLALHWDWVNAVSERFFGGTSAQARVYYLLDTALLAGFALIITTGLVISTWLNLGLSNYSGWLSAHILISLGTLAALVLKLGLHWRWIVRAVQKTVGRPATLRPPAPARQPAVQAVSPRRAGGMGRREFLQVMGVVGAASLLAAASASKSLAMLESAADETTTAAANSGQSVDAQQAAAARSGAASSGACTIRCNRRCAYPGHCGRYTDSNGNNRCDLGECA
jgi:hypothetical protein